MAVKTTNKNPNNSFQSNKKRDNHNNRKAPSSSSSSFVSSPPPLDKWIKPLAGIAIALLAYQFLKGMIQSDISRIDLEDELELRKVFFGEVLTSEENHNNHVPSPQNYAVLCHPETATYPISSVFEEAAKDGSAPAIFRVIDCHTVMAGSDKTVLERFQLNDKIRPLVFVSGKQGPPKQVPAKHLKTGTMLTKALKNLLTPKAEKIETTQDLRIKCLDKDICGLLLKGSKTSPAYVKNAMEKLVVEYPQVAFVAIDSSVLYLKGIEAEYLPEFQSGVPRFVVFKKVAGSANKNTNTENNSRLKTSILPLDSASTSVGYGPITKLIDSVIVNNKNNNVLLQPVSALPTIKTRTKKLEEEERQKRQRRQEQQQRQQQKQQQQQQQNSQSGGGYFDSFRNSNHDDNNKDDKRAERERLRAEHRANNPNYREKTPEELLEQERQRRIRMEQEAQKWNIVPEDEDGHHISEEGRDSGPVESRNGESMDWDDNDEGIDDTRESSSSSNSGIEEDVLDLDD